MVDELRPTTVGGLDEVAVAIGEERDLRVAEGRAGDDAPQPLGSLGHERRVGGHRDGQDDDPLRAKLAPDLDGCFDRRTLARDDDLARGVPIRDPERALGRSPTDELRQGGFVKADDRRHGPVATRAAGLHPEAALADEPDAVGQGQGSSRHEGRVLAHRVAGHEPRAKCREPRRGDALTEHGEPRHRGCEEGRLCVLGSVQVVSGALPGERAQRLGERGVGRVEDRGGGR